MLLCCYHPISSALYSCNALLMICWLHVSCALVLGKQPVLCTEINGLISSEYCPADTYQSAAFFSAEMIDCQAKQSCSSELFPFTVDLFLRRFFSFSFEIYTIKHVLEVKLVTF